MTIIQIILYLTRVTILYININAWPFTALHLALFSAPYRGYLSYDECCHPSSSSDPYFYFFNLCIDVTSCIFPTFISAFDEILRLWRKTLIKVILVEKVDAINGVVFP